MRKSMWKAGLAAVALLAFAPAANAADDGVNVGTLRCNVDGGWGHVVASSRQMHCVFNPVDGRDEHYTGELSRYGVDIGYTSDAVLVWGVIAPTSDMRRGGLEGDYGGASAQATVGVGLGANVLVGGSNDQIALQPASVEGVQGLNVAAGFGQISLKASK